MFLKSNQISKDSQRRELQTAHSVLFSWGTSNRLLKVAFSFDAIVNQHEAKECVCLYDTGALRDTCGAAEAGDRRSGLQCGGPEEREPRRAWHLYSGNSTRKCGSLVCKNQDAIIQRSMRTQTSRLMKILSLIWRCLRNIRNRTNWPFYRKYQNKDFTTCF